jgi:hypothetical protein
MAKVTQRTELGPLRALPTVRQARIERGMRLGLAQCAQLTFTPDVVWDRDSRSGCAPCVGMMKPADRPDGDYLPPIGGLAPWLQARSGGGEQGVQQAKHGCRPA